MSKKELRIHESVYLDSDLSLYFSRNVFKMLAKSKTNKQIVKYLNINSFSDNQLIHLLDLHAIDPRNPFVARLPARQGSSEAWNLFLL